MLRRFLLVGLYLVIQPGSLMQLMLGTLTAAIFFYLQMQARPYARATDNSIAGAASFCLVVFFVCCIMFKVEVLIESLHDKRRDFDMPVTLLTSITFVSLLATGLATLGMLAKQLRDEKERQRREELLAKARRLRLVADGSLATVAPLASPSDFHLFLSHTWAQGQSDMRVLKQKLLEMLPSMRVFLDVRASSMALDYPRVPSIAWRAPLPPRACLALSSP